MAKPSIFSGASRSNDECRSYTQPWLSLGCLRIGVEVETRCQILGVLIGDEGGACTQNRGNRNVVTTGDRHRRWCSHQRLLGIIRGAVRLHGHLFEHLSCIERLCLPLRERDSSGHVDDEQVCPHAIPISFGVS